MSTTQAVLVLRFKTAFEQLRDNSETEDVASGARVLPCGAELTTSQKSAVAGCAVVLIWSIAGLIVNPDFSIGTEATSELVLGVDMNGWHAVSGFLVIVPVLAVLRNEELLPWVMLAAAVGLFATAGWAMFSEYPAGGLFYFPNRLGDVLLHLGTTAIFGIGAWVGLSRREADRHEVGPA